MWDITKPTTCMDIQRNDILFVMEFFCFAINNVDTFLYMVICLLDGYSSDDTSVFIITAYLPGWSTFPGNPKMFCRCTLDF